MELYMWLIVMVKQQVLIQQVLNDMNLVDVCCINIDVQLLLIIMRNHKLQIISMIQLVTGILVIDELLIDRDENINCV
jgi:hypothetical protein